MNRSPYQRKDSKSFYVLLSVCVLSVIAASLGVTLTAKKIRSSSKEETGTTVNRETETPFFDPGDESDVGEANKEQTGVPDERKQPEPSESMPDSTAESTQEAQTSTQKPEPEDDRRYLPVGTGISKDYSDSVPVRSKTMNDYRIHNGVDFSAESGDTVHAVCAGQVKKIGNDSSWGTYVEILHGDITARYCGFDTVSVKEGDTVKGNDAIGTLGIIPVESADSTHLHLEATAKGETVDPIAALGIENTEE